MDTDKTPHGVCVSVCVCVCVCVCVKNPQYFREGREDLGKEPDQKQTAYSNNTQKGGGPRTGGKLVPQEARD